MKLIKNGRDNGCAAKRITCDGCHSEIEYTGDDLDYGAFGCGEITCPVCENKIDIDEECIDLTCKNIEFPKHFLRTGKDVLKISDADIQIYARECLKSLVEDADHDYGIFAITELGDTMVIGIKYEDEYELVVAKDTWCCCIPR